MSSSTARKSSSREAKTRKIRLVTLMAMALKTGLRRRGQHSKQHGLVRAKFEIPDDLPASHRVGLFARPGTYDALIRFSNGPQKTDRDRGAQGMAIKLLGVPGRKLLDDPPDAETHDFILIDGPVFFVRDTDSYARLVGELAVLGVVAPEQHPRKWLEWLKKSHPEDIAVVDAYHDRIADSPLARQFWSQVPYAFGEAGETICRYSCVPHAGNMLAPIPAELRSKNYLRQAMINHLVLAGRPAAFDFCVQTYEHATPEVIDNPTVQWNTPVQRVAVITIPAQDFNRPEQDLFGETLSYTPWHALPDHRPVGQINEIRRTVYALSSRVRHFFRATPRREPTSPFPPKRKGRTGFWLKLVGSAAVAAIVAAIGIVAWVTHVPLPQYVAAEKQMWLAQNWSPGAREWYHHANQGGQFPPLIAVPYDWFIALEQPVLSIGAADLLSDQNYLDRFGFIPSTAEGGAYDWRTCREPQGSGGYDNGAALPSHRHRLPVGFACTDPAAGPMVLPDGRPWRNAASGSTMSAIGLTCAACHTGRLKYGSTEVLIDGGSAMTDIVKLNTAIAWALVFTAADPLRFDRFALRLLGANSNQQSRAELSRQLDDAVSRVKQLKKLDASVHKQGVEEGFGRLDALNRIGNQIFSIDLGKPENYAASSAPVHYPRIWDVPWFEWAQYNASIGQPMVRNAGEALGTGAPIVLQAAPPGAKSLTAPLYSSNVEFTTLAEMEQLLAGQQPNEASGFTGLVAPKWPANVFGPIDAKLAERGARLYADKCEHCHLPPVSSPAFWSSPNWKTGESGYRFLKVTTIPIEEVGTDDRQAEGMMSRTVAIPADIGLSEENFGKALGQLVEKAVNQWYESQTPPVPDAKRNEMNGFRRNTLDEKPQYKARPLDGVWATPPYLHNGSVPTIDALLSPLDERPKVFWLGHRDYDPKRLGYQYDRLAGGFEFDTTKPGNSNAGHEFDDGPARRGRIGRKLSAEDRAALIEYLKSL